RPRNILHLDPLLLTPLGHLALLARKALDRRRTKGAGDLLGHPRRAGRLRNLLSELLGGVSQTRRGHYLLGDALGVERLRNRLAQSPYRLRLGTTRMRGSAPPQFPDGDALVGCFDRFRVGFTVLL